MCKISLNQHTWLRMWSCPTSSAYISCSQSCISRWQPRLQAAPTFFHNVPRLLRAQFIQTSVTQLLCILNRQLVNIGSKPNAPKLMKLCTYTYMYVSGNWRVWWHCDKQQMSVWALLLTLGNVLHFHLCLVIVIAMVRAMHLDSHWARVSRGLADGRQLLPRGWFLLHSLKEGRGKEKKSNRKVTENLMFYQDSSHK